jgi:xylulokinase
VSFLGIDLGTSGVRVIAVTLAGETIAGHGLSTRLRTNGARVEGDADEILAAVRECVRAVLATPAVQDDPPQAVSFSSQGEAILPVDGALAPLAPMPVSMDGRGAGALAEFSHLLSEARFQEVTGQPAHPMFSVFKLLVADDAWRRGTRYLGIADLVAARWGADQVIDHSQAARFGLFDVEKLAWSEEILSAVQDLGATWVTPERLPRVAPAGTVVGAVSAEASTSTGLEPGTPIVVGLHDQAAAYLGGGGRVGRSSVISFGSSDCLVVGTEQRPSGLVGTGLATYPLGADLWVTLAGTAAGGWSLDWLSSIMGLSRGDRDELLGDISEAPPNLLVLPHLAGSGTLDNDPGSTGVVTGLTMKTTRADLVRAFMESAGFELRRIIDALAQRGVDVGSLLATGSGSTNKQALAVRASALGLPLASVDPQAAARGAALVAGVGVGAYPGLDALPAPEAAAAAGPDPQWSDWYWTQNRRYAQLIAATHSLPRNP